MHRRLEELPIPQTNNAKHFLDARAISECLRLAAIVLHHSTVKLSSQSLAEGIRRSPKLYLKDPSHNNKNLLKKKKNVGVLNLWNNCRGCTPARGRLCVYSAVSCGTIEGCWDQLLASTACFSKNDSISRPLKNAAAASKHNTEHPLFTEAWSTSDLAANTMGSWCVAHSCASWASQCNRSMWYNPADWCLPSFLHDAHLSRQWSQVYNKLCPNDSGDASRIRPFQSVPAQLCIDVVWPHHGEYVSHAILIVPMNRHVAGSTDHHGFCERTKMGFAHWGTRNFMGRRKPQATRLETTVSPSRMAQHPKRKSDKPGIKSIFVSPKCSRLVFLSAKSCGTASTLQRRSVTSWSVIQGCPNVDSKDWCCNLFGIRSHHCGEGIHTSTREKLSSCGETWGELNNCGRMFWALLLQSELSSEGNSVSLSASPAV